MSPDSLLFPALANGSNLGHVEQWMMYADVKRDEIVATIAQHLPPTITFGEITPEVIERYQVARITAADNSTFNLEIGLIIATLKNAEMWDGALRDMYREYTPPNRCSDLPPREGYVPPAPEIVEYHNRMALQALRKKVRVFLAAAICNEKLRLGYLHAQFTIGTGIAFDDSRYIRLSDINRGALTVRVRGYHIVPEKIVTVRGNDGILALDELIKRSRDFGASDDDFFLPFKHGSRGWTPVRPMTHHTLLNQYHLINKDQNIPYYAHITPEDLRSLYGTQPLNEIEPDLPPAPEVPATHASPDAGKLYDMAKDVNAKIGDGMVSIKSLIARLRQAGVAPDVILGIISDTE